MAWKLNSVDFSTYGVKVTKSSGVLDIPAIQENYNNWLDQNGKDYFGAIKYNDREIVLSCIIEATGYTSFKSKVATFFAAITNGIVELETPWNTLDVYVQNEIVVNRSAYVRAINIGLFNIRLTVQGDSKSKLMTIYDPTGTVRAIVKYGSDAKLVRQLMGDSSVSFQTDFKTIQSIGRGDYVIYQFEKYILLEYPQIDKFSTNKFSYRLNFVHHLFLLKDIQFRIQDRSETAIYETVEGIIDILIVNVNRAYPGLIVKGTIATTEYRNHQFTNENCYDVLNRIVSEYELEYDYKVALSGNIQITVEKEIGFATGILFEYGKGNTLYKLNRVSTGRDQMVTRLYAYGSARNIPASYGFPRLKLAVEPIERDFFGMHVEKTKIFEDIFPERTGTITSYSYTPPDPITEPETAKYELIDTTMPFDLNDVLIAGSTPKIHFNSGSLAGFEFEVCFYDHDATKFEIIPINEQGGLIPNATLYPSSGDEYKLIDIDLPESYVTDAESRLQDAADAFIDDNYNPKPTFTVETNPVYEFETLYAGDTVNVTDTDFGLSVQEIRVNSITTNIYQGGSTIVLANFSTKSKRQKIELKVAELDRIVDTINFKEVNTLRNSQETVGELSNKLIDPTDNHLKADDIVRSESIDPRMLSYDAGIMQFYIKDALIETNVGGDEDEVAVGAGEISITNWRPNTLTRRELEILATPYDPTRTWIIPATNFTLATKDTYYLYATVNLADGSTACSLSVSTEHIEVKITDGYLKYKLGFISAGEE